MRIWVTRTAPDNASSAARLRQLGHDVVTAPVLEVRRSEAEPICFEPDAIVFTSCNGVRHHRVNPELLNLPVFAVGDRTAREARLSGYLDVRSAAGDVRDLQRAILDQLPPPALILHYAARDVAGDLRGVLRRFGYLVERRTVYAAHSVAVRWLLEVRNQLGSIDGILVHSPRAADRVARVLAGTRWTGSIWCISEACALRLAGVPGIEIHFALRPTEDALIEMIRQHDVVRIPCRAAPRLAAVGAGLSQRSPREMSANDNDESWPGGSGPGGGSRDDPPPAA